MLTDKHVNFVQRLQCRKFKSIAGLQSMLNFHSGGFRIFKRGFLKVCIAEKLGHQFSVEILEALHEIGFQATFNLHN